MAVILARHVATALRNGGLQPRTRRSRSPSRLKETRSTLMSKPLPARAIASINSGCSGCWDRPAKLAISWSLSRPGPPPKVLNAETEDICRSGLVEQARQRRSRDHFEPPGNFILTKSPGGVAGRLGIIVGRFSQISAALRKPSRVSALPAPPAPYLPQSPGPAKAYRNRSRRRTRILALYPRGCG
jgi:hypothetical protein